MKRASFDELLSAFDDALNVRPHLVFEIGYTRVTGWMVQVWDATGVGIRDAPKIVTTQAPDRDEAMTLAAVALRELFPANTGGTASADVKLSTQLASEMSSEYVSQSGSERLMPFRADAKADDDGNCTVCGCLWDDAELEGRVQHVCPEGFRTFVIPNDTLHGSSEEKRNKDTVEPLVCLCYRLARHILNPDNIPLMTWARIGLEMLAELRDFDQVKYAETMKSNKEIDN